MLILSRREAECICLGEDIVLTIVAVGNDKVRIGVKAPTGVRILRTELEIKGQAVGQSDLPEKNAHAENSRAKHSSSENAPARKTGQPTIPFQTRPTMKKRPNSVPIQVRPRRAA